MKLVRKMLSSTMFDQKQSNHRTANNKVFGIGLSRTGTTSLHHALDSLGYNGLHFYPEKIYASYEQVSVGNYDFSKLDKYEAFTDFPSQLLYKELKNEFPDSKFIYTTRPIDDWLSSMEWLIRVGSKKWNWGNWEHRLHGALYGIDGPLTYDEIMLRDVFVKHSTEVHETFSDDDTCLLLLDLQHGNEANWSKLTEFLGLQSTSGNYPESNSS